ncbi:vWA domain-containing protein [Luedemannella helvata]|uniref:VWFA domain-containing protein n=1 Tax=Luedemannella helvata TaxID=349315 RepID=A0ABP4WD20_9ACTN
MNHIRVAVAAAVLAAVPLVGVGTAAASAPPVTVEDLYAALSVRDVPAEYVILVDVSSSMQDGVDLYNPVRRHLREFLANLSEIDHVTVIPFAEAAQTRRVVEGQVGRQPDRLLRGLPATAEGRETDMGTAMEKAVARLARPGRPAIAAVFMLTDGRHTTLPGSGSAYPTASGRQWNRLRDAADKMIATKQHFSAYFTLLGRNASGREGRGCASYSAGELRSNPFCRVFHDGAALAPATVSDLDRRLNAPRTAVLAAKVRAALGEDPRRAVAVRWSSAAVRFVSGTATARVALSNPTRLPLTVSDLRVDTPGGDVTARLSATGVELAPHATTTVDVTLTWAAGRSYSPATLVPIHRRSRLTATVESPFSRILTEQIGVRPAWRLADNDLAVTGGGAGDHLPLLITGVVGLLVVAVLIVVYRFPRLQGTLVALPVLPARKHNDGVLEPNVKVPAPAAKSPRPEPYERIELSGRRPRPFVLGPSAIRERYGVPGEGTVRMRHVDQPSFRRSDLRVEITYGPSDDDERFVTALCRPNDHVIINGVRFEWHLTRR